MHGHYARMTRLELKDPCLFVTVQHAWHQLASSPAFFDISLCTPARTEKRDILSPVTLQTLAQVGCRLAFEPDWRKDDLTSNT